MSKGLHGSFPLALLPVTHFSFLGWFYSPLLRSSWQVSKSSGIFKILGVSTTLTGFSLLYAMNSHSLFPCWAFLEELPGHTHCKVYEAFWNHGGKSIIHFHTTFSHVDNIMCRTDIANFNFQLGNKFWPLNHISRNYLILWLLGSRKLISRLSLLFPNWKLCWVECLPLG